MKYQLRYLLHQLEHRKMAQVQESGLVEDWMFPLEKAVRQALESLESGQVVKDWQRVVQGSEMLARPEMVGLVSGQEMLAQAGQVFEVEAQVVAQEQVTALEQAEGLESGYWKPQPPQH